MIFEPAAIAWHNGKLVEREQAARSNRWPFFGSRLWSFCWNYGLLERSLPHPADFLAKINKPVTIATYLYNCPA